MHANTPPRIADVRIGDPVYLYNSRTSNYENRLREGHVARLTATRIVVMLPRQFGNPETRSYTRTEGIEVKTRQRPWPDRNDRLVRAEFAVDFHDRQDRKAADRALRDQVHNVVGEAWTLTALASRTMTLDTARRVRDALTAIIDQHTGDPA